jgi:hypothetical protein
MFMKQTQETLNMDRIEGVQPKQQCTIYQSFSSEEAGLPDISVIPIEQPTALRTCAGCGACVAVLLSIGGGRKVCPNCHGRHYDRGSMCDYGGNHSQKDCRCDPYDTGDREKGPK